MTFLNKYIGDKKFYRLLIILVLPIVVQQGITNFVSLLDNLMVGSLGTLQMSGVSIVNQLIFVFNLAIFGGVSGVSTVRSSSESPIWRAFATRLDTRCSLR